MNKNDLQYRMYSTVPNLVIGFHGCDRSVADKIINGETNLKQSQNSYDWLGNGMYFWEQNITRAWHWANESAKRSSSSVKDPAVIGAVIDLGYCLNLLDARSIDLLKKQYDIFIQECALVNKKIPENKNIGENKDLLLRNLDCAVIESLHRTRAFSSLIQFDSVRGVFLEGDSIYNTSGFKSKTHIQICVRNPNCIKGFFLPRNVDNSWRIP